MLNALANQGFLPRNGQNIDENTTAKALDTALNIPPEFGKLLHKAAVRTNPTGNVTNSFNLDHLARHNILEHDASLSRQDAAFGNNIAFNETVFSETRSNWQDTIDVQQAAKARLARVNTSNATNPSFGFTKIGEQFSVGESAAYLIVLGNKTTRTANRTVVEYLFGEWNAFCICLSLRLGLHLESQPDDRLRTLGRNSTLILPNTPQRKNVCQPRWGGHAQLSR